MAFLTIQELNTHLHDEQVETITRGDETIAQAAIDAAKAQYTGAYDQVYATYDVTAVAWTVSFSKSAAGAKTDRLVVDAAGKVMAAGK